MHTDFQYFQSYLFTNRRCLEYVTDKSKSSESLICYMLARLQKMFKYDGLPDSIPRQYLENYLLVNGSCVIGRDLMHPEDKNIYAFVGAAGGEPDIYYRPTRYMVANPSLRTSMQYYISTTDPNEEPNAVLVRNDTMWQGLYPMMARYASLISENILTIRTADIMLRVLALITAPDDSSRLAADQFLKDITDGKLASIGENRFLDGIHMQNPPSNNGSYLTQFIELHQYLVGSFYNEVGLNANYNMKREALSESETGLNDDSLMPLCEDMLRCRREDMASVNEMFGTSITVDFDSSWLENTIERLISLKQQAAEASSQLDNPAPLEAGMEDVGLEGASIEGVSISGENGIDEEENGDGNDSGSLDSDSEEFINEGGDSNEESGDDGDSSGEEGSGDEEAEEKGEEDDGEVEEEGTEDEGTEEEGTEEEGTEDEKIIDGTGTSDTGIDVRVEVEVKTASDGEDQEGSDEGEENGKEVDDNKDEKNKKEGEENGREIEDDKRDSKTED